MSGIGAMRITPRKRFPSAAWTVVGCVAAGALVGSWAGVGAKQLDDVATQVILAAVVVVMLVVRAWHRGRADGYGDMLHPMILPLCYVAFSFLAPVWMAFVVGSPPQALDRSTPLSAITTALLVLGVFGFAAGAFFASSVEKAKALRKEFSGRAALISGRLLILIPISISAYLLAIGSVATRGTGQLTVTSATVLSTLLAPTAIAAIALMLIGSRVLGREPLLAKPDMLMIVVLMGLTAGRGTRGDIFAMILLLVTAHAHRRGKYRIILVGGIAMLVVSVVVLQYRADAKGRVIDHTVSEMVLGDMAVAGYTTGATAAAVPDPFPYERGRTYAEAIVRQLPSPIVNPLIGPPEQTGPRIFRQIAGLKNPNQGYGFSIPAEGYLNFGIVGVPLACGLLGLLYSWAYSRTSFVNGRVSGLLYPIAVSALPFGLRSDSLGFMKNILYPLIAIGLVLAFARAQGRSMNRPNDLSLLGESSAS